MSDLQIKQHKKIEFFKKINEAIKLKIKKISVETGAGEFFKPARKLFDLCGFKHRDHWKIFLETSWQPTEGK